MQTMTEMQSMNKQKCVKTLKPIIASLKCKNTRSCISLMVSKLSQI